MRLIVYLIILILVAGCSTTSVPFVQRLYDQQADFSRLQRFSWLDVNSATKVTSRYRDAVRNAVQAELESKGYRYSETATDFRVGTYITVEQKTVTIADGSYLKNSIRSAPGESLTVQVNEGALFVDFYTAGSEAQFFQGFARTTINQTLSEKQRKNQIKKAVVQILADIPLAQE